MSAIVLVASLSMLAATAAVVAPRLGVQALPGVVLAFYLIAFAEVVVLMLALSVVGALERTSLVLAIAILFAAALVLRRKRPKPRRRIARTALAGARSALGDPLLAVLTAVFGVAFCYGAALGMFTPPNDWDAMTYHLARAALWIQQDGVGYVPDAQVVRINANPPNAEIGGAFTMLLSGGERFVWLVQCAAFLALAIGIFALSRRLGLDGRAALLGALLFASLPPIVLQSSSALNDLVVASFLLAGTYFLLGRTCAELALGGLAIALAVGTKFTALIALPLLALVTLAGQPRRRWSGVLMAGLGGLAAGSYWLVVNVVETGSLDGGAATELDQHPDRSPQAVLARTTRLLVNFADDLNLDQNMAIYVVAAVAFAIGALVLDSHPHRRWLLAATVSFVGCLPLVMTSARELLLRVHEKLWLTLGEPELAFLGESRESWSPSTVLSYYGPLAPVMLVASTGLVAYAWRDRAVRPLALLLAGAPIVFAPVLALAIVYDPWRARFFAFALALSAATWGVALHRRALAWGLVSIATTTLFLTFVHSIEKPAGVRLVATSTEQGVWGRPRATVQSWLRPDGTSELVHYFARQPVAGRVGLRVDEDDWVYPYFGRTLEREVSFLSAGADLETFDWLVFRPGAVVEPGPDWKLALQTEDGWRVYSKRQPAAGSQESGALLPYGSP